ncbi:chemerin-like receptor 2 [Discoglossus pictus]
MAIDELLFDNYSYAYDYYELEETSQEVPEYHVVHILSMIIFSLAFLVGVPGNAMVIWFTGFKWEKTVNTLWFLNLAIADLIFVLFMPLHITYVATNFHWPFGTLLCKVNSFIAQLNLFASVFFLTVISLDRFLSVGCPSFSQRHWTLRTSMIISGIVWIMAAIIAGPALYFRDTITFGKAHVVCFNNFHESSQSIRIGIHAAFTLVRFLFGYLIPLITMIVCYSYLAIKMKKKTTLASRKFFWTILAVVVAFFICWTPFHIFTFLELFHIQYFHEVLMIGMPLVTSLAFVNSCLNPILYVLISKVFRDSFKITLAAIFKRTLQELSQTGTVSEQLMDSENKPTICETAS